MWQAIHIDHKPVQIVIDGETVATFEKIDDQLHILIDGRSVVYNHLS